MAKVVLTLAWSTPADPKFLLSLLEVWHNGAEVSDIRHTRGSSISVAFDGEPDSDGEHTISWNTSFKGHTIRTAVATVEVDDQPWKTIPKSVQARTHKNDWDDGLTATERAG